MPCGGCAQRRAQREAARQERMQAQAEKRQQAEAAKQAAAGTPAVTTVTTETK